MNFLRLPPALAALAAAFILRANAGYPLPVSYQNVLRSPVNNNVTISYTAPDPGTCMTAFTTQRQYTGYIELPPYSLAPIQQNYSINTFFWFIESRQTPESAPLTIFLSGGPGTSSMFGLFNEAGPCEVVQTSDGTFGTQARMWGWDRASNILFIDQPNQVGFSYDTATNASFNLFTGEIFEPPTDPVTSGLPDYMFLNGTFGTTQTNNTANTTEIAAQATWHFLQSWLSAFPQYNPATRHNYSSTSYTAGIHLFAESYGGKYGPAFVSHFEEQNQLRANGTLPSNTTLAISIESLGIMNGLVDDAVQDYYYPFFAYNNTYGIQAINQADELNSLELYTSADQCLDQINVCRSAMNTTDPNGDGDVSATNTICQAAQLACANISNAYYNNGYDPYDIRQKLPSPDPSAAYQEYLNTDAVLAAIGAPINYTESSKYVQDGFISTGDTIRGGQMQEIANLLSMGIRVAFIYGDADYICNWFGGQAVSLAVASLVPDSPQYTATAASAAAPSQTNASSNYSSAFPAAGYADIVVNATYVGGAVRQYGNLSFSRIYDAGHFVPYFQPETAFTVFARIIQGTDISTGEPVDLSSFGSVGPANSTHTNVAPTAPSSTCWIRSFNSTCSDDETVAMLAGKGVVANGIFFSDNSISLPSSSVVAGIPGSPMRTSIPSGTSAKKPGGTPVSTVPLTGVYTATATPSPTGNAGRPVSVWGLGLGVPATFMGLGMGVVAVWVL